MRDHLLDLVEHTFDLGFIELVKITGTDTETVIDGLAEDRSVVVSAKFKQPVAEFKGTFGMPNLSKLKILLGIPEYKDNAQITVQRQDRNGENVPVGLHFENAAGDFKNDYRFMTSEIIAEKLKTVKFKGAKWEVEFQPSMASIARMKLMAAAHSEETVFAVRTEDENLVFYFGDASTHAGSFVFQHEVGGALKHTWSWPVAQVQAILNLDGESTMSISDQGAMKITIDSGLATYDYILPAQSK